MSALLFYNFVTVAMRQTGKEDGMGVCDVRLPSRTNVLLSAREQGNMVASKRNKRTLSKILLWVVTAVQFSGQNWSGPSA